MKNLCFLIILIFSILVSVNSIFGQRQQQQQLPPALKQCKIKFDPRGYQGDYYVTNAIDKITFKYVGYTELLLPVNYAHDADNSHAIQIGGTGYTNAMIYFQISSDCKVSSTESKKQAVVFSDKIITFKNVQIEIDPQEYGGEYVMKGFRRRNYDRANSETVSITPDTLTSRSNTIFTVVPNVGSFIEVNGLGIGSVIYFTVAENGNLIVDAASLNSATAAGNKLTLKNVRLSVNPITFTGRFQMGTVYYQGLQELIVVPDLKTFIQIVEGEATWFTPKLACVEPYKLKRCTNPVTIEVIDTDNKLQRFSLDVSAM